MASVVELAGVTIVRGGSTLVEDVTWQIDESDRWVVIGPNGAGKTTLLQVLAAQIHPTSGVAGLLGEVLGTVDVFELRPRIGLTSSAPGGRSTTDLIMSVPPNCWHSCGSTRSPTGQSGLSAKGNASAFRSRVR